MEEISEHRIDKWETLMFTYESALKEIATKIDIPVSYTHLRAHET